MKKYFHSLLIIFVLAGLSDISAQSGLDLTFGGDGKVIKSIGTNFNQATSVIVQPNGKIIIAGNAQTSLSNDFSLIRLNSDGSLDHDFGIGGVVTADFSGHIVAASELALQGDGKIVVTGGSYNGIDDDFALARYKINGALDSSFGAYGLVTTDFGGNDISASVAVQPNQKIITAGYSERGTDYVFALARYNIDGTLDRTFGLDGKVITDFGGYGDQARSVAIQSDGKIIAAGYSDNGSFDYFFALARYNSDGTLDNSFGTRGKVITNIRPDIEYAYSVNIQPDGKIIVVGTGGGIVLVRYNQDGALDNTFGIGGKVITANYNAYSSALQPDGKIIVVGYSSYYNDSSGFNYLFLLARYNSNGSLDSDFGTDGILTTDFGTNDARAYSVAIQPDGKIVVAGTVQFDIYHTSFAVARYLSGLASDVIDFPFSNNLLTLYPNPNEGHFSIYSNLPFASNITFQIFNSLGQTNTTETHAQPIHFDLSNQPKGIYFISISSGDMFIETKKFIIY